MHPYVPDVNFGEDETCARERKRKIDRESGGIGNSRRIISVNGDVLLFRSFFCKSYRKRDQTEAARESH